MPLPPLLLFTSVALAGIFTPKTMTEPWPERQVERDLVLPKGWLQIGLGFDHKTSTQVRDKDDALQPMDEGVAFSYSQMWLRVDQGFSRRIRIYAHAPVVRAALSRDGETAVETMALGDVRTGIWVQPWLDRRAIVAGRVELKTPSGVEWPGALQGGPGSRTSFLTGTGTTHIGLTSHGKLQLGNKAALKAVVGYVFTLPSVVGYVVEVDGYANGWINPGDELNGRLEGTVQAGDALAFSAGATRRMVGNYQVGTSGPSVWKADLAKIPNSSGQFWDLDAHVSLEPSEHMELIGSLGWQAAGNYTGVFSQLGLVQFSPMPGVTAGLDVVSRW
jgi:hypothetical protein